MHETMTMTSANARTGKPLVQVRTLHELDDLIRQKEIDTGQPGRDFLVGGADHLTYEVRFIGAGYEIRRSDAAGLPAIYASRFQLGDTLLGHALVEGCLFTSRLQ
jgi:hypothetical protein